ncbi:hypothetical protein O181_012923 [Austropuccinia psidii MF-1]|uniref:Retrovirus-related Pol polyprotein from transposon TNT 1-94-like beta-barrel domain-containing protein n=1 Tax=Austropuccinia psidii MF-1 TaxID=1389203 RepID=A0A9Q3BXP3_9BASI|nr:hypothetical protein [Austropuccinia psidii MF-1]
MNNINQNNDLQKIIPILTDKNYSEWKLRMIISLKQQRLYQYCVKQSVPGDGETRTPAVEAKLIDANVEACGIITNFMDSRTKARVWSKFQKLTYENNLKEFIANTRKCLSDIALVGIAVEDEILAFSILTKLPEEFHSLIEKVTLNADTQGNPDAILNVLHEAALKEEALSTESTKALALNKENFPSKVVHYCSNGRHKPLVTTHGPDKFWQLHPELKPERKRRNKEQKPNFTISRALFTQNSRNSNTMLTLVLDTGASNHMFNNKHFFENLHQDNQTNVATGCDKSTLVSKGQGLEKIYDRLGNLWLLPNSLYVPELTRNLLPLSAIAKNETRIKRTSSQFEIYLDNNNKPSFICPISSSVLETQIKLTNSHFLSTQAKENSDIWHK